MSGLLNFHRLAAERGDGLHPRLLVLLLARDSLATGNAGVIELANERGDHMVQAGPNPARPLLPHFMPGNVLRFEPKAAKAAAAPRKSSASSK